MTAWKRTSGSSVRLPAKLTPASVMVLSSWDCLAGRSALPLDPGDGGHRGMPRDPPGASGGANEIGHRSRLPAVAGSVPGWLGERLAAGGRACQHRPARSLHPGCGGRTRLPPRELPAARPRLLLSAQEREAVVSTDCGGSGVEGVEKPGSVGLVH